MNSRIEKKVGKRIVKILGAKAKKMFGGVWYTERNGGVDRHLSKKGCARGTPAVGGWYDGYDTVDSQSVCSVISELYFWSFPEHPQGHGNAGYPNHPKNYRVTGKRLIEHARKLANES